MTMSTWPVFQGNGVACDDFKPPPAPPWRQFGTPSKEAEGKKGPPKLVLEQSVIEAVNASIFLRRPLLVSGGPGTGKSSLARMIAHELGLGRVLYWPIYTKTTLQDGLYRYDAIGRFQEGKGLADIANYIRLGPLGTALVPNEKPRVLLIDEIDKSDIDFPNELLHVFEEGWFEIIELSRISKSRVQDGLDEVFVQLFDEDKSIPVRNGRVQCQEFPIVVMTSNSEREFPAPFLRRCMSVTMKPLNSTQLMTAVENHFGVVADAEKGAVAELIGRFLGQTSKEPAMSSNPNRAMDQLLNAVELLVKRGVDRKSADVEALRHVLLRDLK